MKKPFYTWDGDTLVLNILGTPNAKRDAIGKVWKTVRSSAFGAFDFC